MPDKQQIRPLIFIVLFIMVQAPLMAQPYYFKHYQVENGLSNNTVYTSIQDKSGFLWFGTKEGLNRFDGYQFKQFKIHDDQSEWAERELIYCLFNDERGKLWIGTQEGLYHYDQQNEKLIPFHKKLREINGLESDTRGRLWIISGTTITRFDASTNELKEFPTADFFEAVALCRTADGVLWFAGKNGMIYRYDQASETFKEFNIYNASDPFVSCAIEKILPGPDDIIYIGTSCQGIKAFNTTSGTYNDILVYNDDKTPVYVRDILQYSEEEYWFATESGIFILNIKTGKFTQVKKKFLDPYSLNDNAVYTLCKDTEGGVWAGTYFGGVNYYTRQYGAFKKYFADNIDSSFHGSAVREIVKDPEGFMWIGTEDAGLNKLDPETGKITHFTPDGKPGSISYSNIHGLLVTGNEIWIGTHEHGLDIMDRRTGKVKRHINEDKLPGCLTDNFIISMLESSSGQIYIGTGNSLHKYNKNNQTFLRCTEIPDGVFVSCMIEAHDKTIWLGTYGSGVYFIDPVTGKSGKLEDLVQNPLLATANTINSIVEDREHNIWFATEGAGALKLAVRKKELTNINVEKGLPSNFIFKILEDKKGRIWMTSSKGLVSIDREQKIRVFTRSTGLLNDQFNYNSGYADSSGTLYFGSVKGMVSLNPEQCFTNYFVPPLYITGFHVQQSAVTSSQKGTPVISAVTHTRDLTLGYNQASFSIDFAALSFVSPEMTTYRYMLEGINETWNELSTNRRIYYTNLAPGKYVFHVQAGRNGQWTGKETTLNITINPPWWKSWMALFIYLASGLTLIFFIVKSYIQRAREKRERELYAAKIDFFTAVAHEIRTPLTLIKGPVENLADRMDDYPLIREDVQTLGRNTDRLIALASGVLDFRKTESKGFSLEFTRVNLVALMEETYLDFKPMADQRGLQFKLKIEDDKCYINADEDGIRKILSNLFSNAIKYAETKVSVEIIVEAHSTIMTFINDGYKIPGNMSEKVFEPFFRIRETSKQKGTGIGLALSKSLATLHKGTLQLDTGNHHDNIFILTLPRVTDPVIPEPLFKLKKEG